MNDKPIGVLVGVILLARFIQVLQANNNPIGTFSLLVQRPVVVRRAVYNPVSLISLPVVNFPWKMLFMAKHHRNIAAGI